jgi:hypothetical protein
MPMEVPRAASVSERQCGTVCQRNKKHLKQHDDVGLRAEGGSNILVGTDEAGKSTHVLLDAGREI